MSCSGGSAQEVRVVMKAHRVRSRAFTLVELLVVIAIISMLIALLLPSLKQSRDYANSVACQSNEHQIGIAFASYANDNRDLIPPIGSAYQELFSGPDPAWYQNIGRGDYYGAAQPFKGAIFGFTTNRWPVLRCPGETPRRFDGYPDSTYYDSELVGASYVMNWTVSWYNYGSWYGGAKGYRRGWLRGPDTIKPSEARLVCDVGENGIGWALPYFEWNIDNTSPAYVDGTYGYMFRHPKNTTNFMHMDGHVSTYQHYTRTGQLLWQTLWAVPPVD